MAWITLARAKQAIPNYSDSDALLQDLINACDSTLKRRLGRDIESQTYDELYSGNGHFTLRLNQYPIQSVTSVRWNYFPVITFHFEDATAQMATVQVTSTGLTLKSIKNGTTTSNTLPFATYTTLGALQTAASAISNWTVNLASNYSGWATADLLPQGAYGAITQVARVFAYLYYLSDFQIRANQGELYLPFGWSPGLNNFRIVYTSGYGTVPESLQNAEAELVAATYAQIGINPNLQSESIGAESYTLAADKSFKQLSAAARQALNSFQDYRIYRYPGV